jgi:sodium-coupled monocarboxylate transporter 8/12
MQQTSFSVPDYCVFFAMLAISALIGFYYAYKSKSMKNTDDFLLGGRKLQIFPVAMSIMASFTSAVSVLGFPQVKTKGINGE